LLLLATIIVFGQTTRYDFVNYDDDVYVFNNNRVLGGLTGGGIVWAFTQSDKAAQWVPLTWLSLMTDVQLLGSNGSRPDLARLAARMHLTNIALQAASSIILFLVLWRMTGGLWKSAFVAAVFAVHPLHVESVAWVTERKDMLSGLFGFIAIGAYVWYARQPSVISYLAVFVALALGLMGKPILVTWPLVFLLLDYWPLQRWYSNWLLVEKVPLCLLVAASGMVTFLAHRSQGAVASLESAPLAERLARAAIEYVRYLGKTAWPIDLSAMYNDAFTASYWPAVAAGMLLALFTAGALWGAWRGQRWLAVGWLFYMGTLLPMIGLVQAGAQVTPDRSMYLPQIGISIVLTWGAAQIAGQWRHGRVVFSGGAAMILGASMACAWQQTCYWRNSETLWAHSLQCVPNNAVAENHLGLALAARGAFDDAIGHYRKAVDIQPHYAVAYFNLGLASANCGRFDEAIAAYNDGLKFKPKDAEAHYRLGLALALRGKAGEAIEQLREAVEIQPGFVAARIELALMYVNANRLDDAIDQYNRALEYDPNNAVSNFYLGIALERSGKRREAMERYRTALRLASATNQKALADAIRERINRHR
jgi:tetratricopeptide (TPR) repeat protein